MMLAASRLRRFSSDMVDKRAGGVRVGLQCNPTQRKTDEENDRGDGRVESAHGGIRFVCPMRRSGQGNGRGFRGAMSEVRRGGRIGEMLRGRRGNMRRVRPAQGVARMCRQMCGSGRSSGGSRRGRAGFVGSVPRHEKERREIAPLFFAVRRYCRTAPMSAGPTRRW